MITTSGGRKHRGRRRKMRILCGCGLILLSMLFLLTVRTAVVSADMMIATELGSTGDSELVIEMESISDIQDSVNSESVSLVDPIATQAEESLSDNIQDVVVVSDNAQFNEEILKAGELRVPDIAVDSASTESVIVSTGTTNQDQPTIEPIQSPNENVQQYCEECGGIVSQEMDDIVKNNVVTNGSQQQQPSSSSPITNNEEMLLVEELHQQKESQQSQEEQQQQQQQSSSESATSTPSPPTILEASAIITDNNSNTNKRFVSATLFIDNPTRSNNNYEEIHQSDNENTLSIPSQPTIQISSDDVFDDDDLIPDKNITMPEKVPQYFVPRDITPFLGFDYYMTKADLLILTSVQPQEAINFFSRVLNMKLKQYLRKHHSDEFTAEDDAMISFEPLIVNELTRTYYLAFALLRNELTLEHVKAEWFVGTSRPFHVNVEMDNTDEVNASSSVDNTDSTSSSESSLSTTTTESCSSESSHLSTSDGSSSTTTATTTPATSLSLESPSSTTTSAATTTDTETTTSTTTDTTTTATTASTPLPSKKKIWHDAENLLSILQYKIHLMIFVNFEFLFNYIDFFLFYRLSHFSLISFSNFDFCVPYVYLPRDPIKYKENCEKTELLLSSPFFNYWFAKNMCYEHTKLIPIPLGPKWQFHSPAIFAEDLSIMKRIYLRYGIYPMLYYKNFTNIPEYETQIQALTFVKPKKDRLLYFHFHQYTTDDPFCTEYTNLRQHLWKLLQEKGFPNSPVRSPKGYLDELSRYKFAVAPPGKGLDTHRAWEALMVGTIPIVLSSPLDSLFRGLPVLIVDDYKVLTEEFLYESYQYFHEYPDEFSFEKLFTPYWDRIFAAAANLDNVQQIET